MPSTFTPLLRLTKPGLNDTGWGTTVNNGTFELVDNSIAGLVSVDVTSGNATLTTANGATDQARYMFVRAFGASVARDVVVPATSKLYFVINDCTAAVTFKASGQPGVSVPAGRTAVLRCDGTDVVAAVTYLTELASGGTVTGTKIIPTGNVTAGNGMYLPATNTLAWSTDGAEGMRLDTSGNLGIGTSSPLIKFDVKGATDTHVGITASGIDEAIILAFDDGGIRTPNLSYAAASHKFLIDTTERMRLDSSGNLGLGVTPSAWASGTKALDVGSIGGVDQSGSVFDVSANQYLNASAQRIYKTTDAATIYRQDTGAHKWFTAPSGTAGNAISFTQAMTLDASGNLLVGTTNPELGAGFGNIQIQGSSGAIVQAQTGAGTVKCAISTDSSSAYVGARTNHPLLLITNNTEHARITSGGEFQIGTVNDGNARLTVSGAAGFPTCAISLYETSASARRLRLSQASSGVIYDATYGSGDNAHIWQIGSVEHARITSGGDLLVGTTSAQTWNFGAGGPIQTGGSRPIILSNSGGNISFRGDTGGWAMGMYAFGSSNTARGGFGFSGSADTLAHYWVGTAFNGTGVQLNSGSTSWSTLSDARDKNIHGEIEDALAKIAGIRGVYYNFKTDGIDRRRRVGFIAQDVNAVLPEAVEETQREIDSPTEDTKRLVLSYTELVPLLLNGIKEQQAIINDLRARVAALEAK